jgi:hypothetical protein
LIGTITEEEKGQSHHLLKAFWMLAFHRGISHVQQVGVGNADIDSQNISAVYGIVFPPSILDVVTNVDELDGVQ